MKTSKIDNIFIYWIYFISLLTISIYILGSLGFISALLQADISYISSIISIIFIYNTFSCGYYLYKLRDAIVYIEFENSAHKYNIFLDTYHEYKRLMSINSDPKSVQEDFKIKLYEYIDNGFFVADILLKLGIVGTVIGFIIMLSSLSMIDEINLSKMNNLLLSMSAGMKVALYTTLTGLIGSVLLSIQYNYFESKINVFINKVINYNHYEKKE